MSGFSAEADLYPELPTPLLIRPEGSFFALGSPVNAAEPLPAWVLWLLYALVSYCCVTDRPKLGGLTQPVRLPRTPWGSGIGVEVAARAVGISGLGGWGVPSKLPRVAATGLSSFLGPAGDDGSEQVSLIPPMPRGGIA